MNAVAEILLFTNMSLSLLAVDVSSSNLRAVVGEFHFLLLFCPPSQAATMQKAD